MAKVEPNTTPKRHVIVIYMGGHLHAGQLFGSKQPYLWRHTVHPLVKVDFSHSCSSGLNGP